VVPVGAADDFALAVAVQPDGKLVLAGGARSGQDTFDFALVRLTAAGSPDPSFGGDGRVIVPFDVGGSFSDLATAVAIQPDGRIVAAGRVEASSPGFPLVDYDFGVVRLLADGALDPSFAGDGRTTLRFNLKGGYDDQPWAMALQGDGRILLAGFAAWGTSGDYDFALARLLPDGTPDPALGGHGRTTIWFDLGGDLADRADAIALQADGRILVAGKAQVGNGNDDFAVVRLENDYIFADCFESGGLAAWSTPPPPGPRTAPPSSRTTATKASTSSSRVRQLTSAGRRATLPA
jgi:uncharacterized delta-60 repeat protein